MSERMHSHSDFKSKLNMFARETRHQARSNILKKLREENFGYVHSKSNNFNHNFNQVCSNAGEVNQVLIEKTTVEKEIDQVWIQQWYKSNLNSAIQNINFSFQFGILNDLLVEKRKYELSDESIKQILDVNAFYFIHAENNQQKTGILVEIFDKIERILKLFRQNKIIMQYTVACLDCLIVKTGQDIYLAKFITERTHLVLNLLKLVNIGYEINEDDQTYKPFLKSTIYRIIIHIFSQTPQNILLKSFDEQHYEILNILADELICTLSSNFGKKQCYLYSHLIQIIVILSNYPRISIIMMDFNIFELIISAQMKLGQQSENNQLFKQFCRMTKNCLLFLIANYSAQEQNITRGFAQNKKLLSIILHENAELLKNLIQNIIQMNTNNEKQNVELLIHSLNCVYQLLSLKSGQFMDNVKIVISPVFLCQILKLYHDQAKSYNQNQADSFFVKSLQELISNVEYQIEKQIEEQIKFDGVSKQFENMKIQQKKEQRKEIFQNSGWGDLEI